MRDIANAIAKGETIDVHIDDLDNIFSVFNTVDLILKSNPNGIRVCLKPEALKNKYLEV